MTGTLYVIGTGPGSPEQITLEAQAAIAASSHFFGYKPYIERLNLGPAQIAVPSDNREELDRARSALVLAAEGKSVAMVSGGDPGVFAMASAVCEAIDTGEPDWRGIELVIVPGVTAMLATAARIGAPLGNDFCAMSLSDNLKPWEVIEQRLRAAAGAGFAIAFYNPISKSRPWQLGKALEILREILPPDTVVSVGRGVGPNRGTIGHRSLSELEAETIDMSTCIIVGNRFTRAIARPDKPDLVYTPRWVPDND
ncbi:precorrin-3B C(17)-methyltransferase [Pelagibacterium sp.]|uniref:precorrin-3B C(17)-methyltransferase n=1 Tax=Pelagibacterium sp. TaxID=1967288 RepID=UPI003A922733